MGAETAVVVVAVVVVLVVGSGRIMRNLWLVGATFGPES